MRIRTARRVTALLAAAALPPLAGAFLAARAPADQGRSCDGCERTAIVAGAVGTDAHRMQNLLAELVTSPCFHLMSKDAVLDFREREKEMGLPPRPTHFREPEYYFTIEYEDGLEGPVTSRFTVELFFDNGELVHEWKTEADHPITFDGHLNLMFRNPSAVLRQDVPLDVHVINEFEKRPYTSDIEPEREEVNPGQKIPIKIVNITDIRGQPSREFNRLVVQAVEGDILGGTELEVDPSLKVFRVGDGEISFTYRAPALEPGQTSAEDVIRVYRCCEILDPAKNPLEKTLPKDAIAEKKIRIRNYEGTLTMSYAYDYVVSSEGPRLGHEEHKSATVEIRVGRAEYSIPYGRGGQQAWYYPIVSRTIRSAQASGRDEVAGGEWISRQGGSFQFPKHIQALEAAGGSPSYLIVITDSQTGKMVGLVGLGFQLEFMWSDGAPSDISSNPPADYNRVLRGDGIHTAGGGGEDVSGDEGVTTRQRYEWSFQRQKVPK